MGILNIQGRALTRILCLYAPVENDVVVKTGPHILFIFYFIKAFVLITLILQRIILEKSTTYYLHLNASNSITIENI
jgi:hypothetical protein